MEGEEPPFDADDFVAAGFAAGAEFDAELLLDAGAAAAAGAGVDFAGADDEALELDAAGAAADESDAAADFFERDFLVVLVEESVLAASAFDASVFEADASVESAAAFFDRDFFVVPVEESDEVDADFESVGASVESAAFLERDFLLVPVEESGDVEADESSAFDFFDFEVPDDVEPELSSDDAVDFFFFDFVEESVLLVSPPVVVLPSAAAFFFFFFVVVLLSELESLDEPLADDDDDCAFADLAATDAEPNTKTAQASAVNICCHFFFMIVPPVSNDAKCEFVRPQSRLRVLLVGEPGSVGLGLFEQAGRCGRFECRDTAIEMPAERSWQIRLEMVHDRIDDFLRFVLRQAGLLHDYLDEFIHG